MTTRTSEKPGTKFEIMLPSGRFSELAIETGIGRLVKLAIILNGLRLFGR